MATFPVSGSRQFCDPSLAAALLDPGQVDEAATTLVKIASKFKHNPPTALAVVVGKSGLAYRRPEDGVYVLPITALKA